MTREELEDALRGLPDVQELNVVGDRMLIATVLSRSFEGQDEAERQARVWGLLLDRHPSSKLENVEFIFTNAPGDEQ